MKINNNLIIFCFLFISINSFGQFKGEFSVGPEIKYYYFQIYSKSDWDNKPQSYAIMDNYPNGKNYGISAEYNISNKIGLKAGLFYSSQHQKYLRSYFGGIYDARIKTSLKYVNLPLQMYYCKEITNNSNWYFKGYLGFQFSYSYSYYSEFKQFYVNPDKNYKIEYDSITNLIIMKPFQFYQKFYNFHQNKTITTERKTNYIFNRLIISSILNLGIEKYYRNIFKFGLGLDIQYGINNSENYGDKKYWKGSLGQCALGGRCKSHNRSIGLYLTIQYILNPQSYYK